MVLLFLGIEANIVHQNIEHASQKVLNIIYKASVIIMARDFLKQRVNSLMS